MSAYTTRLKLEKQVSGENSGNWGNLVNYVFNRIDSTVRGYVSLSVAGSANVTLVSNTSTTNTSESADDQVHNKVIEFTGALTGSIYVFTDAVEGDYTLFNNTTGSHTLTFANTGHAANGVAITQSQKALVYTTGSTVVDVLAGAGLTTLTGTQTLTNKTLTAPKIGTSILDTNGNELLLLTATGSAVNELTIANQSTGNNPTITASGETNVGINLVPKGTGILQGGGSALKIAGKETMWVPAPAMFGPTTNPADSAQVETTAGRPDLKVFDFDASTKQYTQFSVAMPKSWNEGTVTYQVYWSPSTTNTGNAIFGLQGVACADGDTIDVAYGTAIEITDAGIGTVEDQQVTSESGAVTIAGSPAAGEQTYFQLYRDAADGSDTFTGECRVLGIKLFFTTDAANDA
jgi:hypothetical protein